MRTNPRRVLATATVLAAVFLAFPPAAADPFHLLIANETTIGFDDVVLDQWVAQSFVPTDNFTLTRVSLNVSDLGVSDVLAVTLRGNLGGQPDATVLASGTADGPPVRAWLDVDLAPRIELRAGSTYWIVARSTMAVAGYEWGHSGTDAAYPPGIGSTSVDGVVWSPSGRDYVFRVFGFGQPALSFAASASSASVNPGQTANFTVGFTNSGAGSAAASWVNASLPAELTYMSDNAASIGGMRSGTYSFAFQNVAPGMYAFRLTTTANTGVPDGTVTTTRFTFEATDHNGVPMTRSWENVTVTIVAPPRVPALSLSVSAANTLEAGQAAAFRVDFANTGTGDAAAVWVNVSLPTELSYVSDDAVAVGGSRSGAYSFAFANIAPGMYSINVTVAAGAAANGTQATTRFTLEATDRSGAPLPRKTENVTLTIIAPGGGTNPSVGFPFPWILVALAVIATTSFGVAVALRRRQRPAEADEPTTTPRKGPEARSSAPKSASWLEEALEQATRRPDLNTQQRLEQALDVAIRKMECSSIAISGRSGLIIAHRVAAGSDPQATAALGASIINAARIVARDLQNADVKQVMIDSTHGKIVAVDAGPSAILLALYEEDANLGIALLGLAKIAGTVAQVLAEV